MISALVKSSRTEGGPQFRHRILLGETDSYSPLPMLPDQFKVHCDSCGKEYWYARKEVLRADLHHPESFASHPLFSTSV